MKTAIITGASSGIGREFALRISERVSLDEMWLIARREEKLQEVASEIKIKTRIICLDLSLEESLQALETTLKSETPEIKVLVNAAGFGKFGKLCTQDKQTIENMINVNIRALTSICRMCAEYMPSGGSIINMASISGFTPLPYLNVYTASKAYVLSFTQSLAEELKEQDIAVTAVCPYWVASEFIPVAQDTPQNDCINNFMCITYPYAVVNKAIKDNSNRKLLSVFGLTAHAIRCLAKCIPTKCIFALWERIRKISSFQCNQQSPAPMPWQ